MRSFLLLFFTILFFSFNSSAQTTNDYRSNGNVSFASSTNWQIYNGSSWVSATAPPASYSFSISNTITIQNNDSATVSASTTVVANVTIIGSLTVSSGASLTTGIMQVGNNNAGSVTVVGALIVNGDLTVTKGGISISGSVFVNGNYSTSTGNVNITGSGSFDTSGSISTQGDGEVFGSSSNCTGPGCSGTSLSCTYTNSVSPSSQALCSNNESSQSIVFSTNDPSYSVTYWEKTTDLINYTNIGFAGVTTLPSQTVTQDTWFRAVFSSSTCNTLKSAAALVDVSSSVPPTTATNTSAQTISSTCGATLVGNSPSVGAGSWSVVSGPSTSSTQFSSITNPTATFTPAGGIGSYVVRWTISTCSSSYKDATITVTAGGPTITGTTPSSVCGTGTVTLGAAASAGTVNWYTAATGGSSLKAATSYTTPSLSSTTTYYVDATSGGCTSSPRTAVTATVSPTPIANAGGSQTICSNTTATVSGASFSNGTIQWTHNGAGSITSGAITLTPVYTAVAGDAGKTVTLTMTVTNSPCANATAIYSIIVNSLPTATAGGSQTICSNATATVNGATSSNGTIQWTHNGAGSITSGATTLTPVYTAAAGDAGKTVTLTMTVTNTACTPAITATATYNVIVKPLPTATAGGSQTICSNATATINGATSSNGTIQWTHNGTGSITGATTLTPVYTAATGDAGKTVTLTMTVTNTTACTPAITAIAFYSVVVNPLPLAAGTITGTPTVCQGQSDVTYSVPAINNATSYTWNYTGTGFTPTASTASIIGAFSATATSGNLTVTGINACGTGIVSATYAITVNPNLPASVSIATTTTTICSGTDVTFTATPTNPGTSPSYQWKVNGSNVGTNSAVFTTTTLADSDVVNVQMSSSASPCSTGSPSTSNAITMTVNAIPATPTFVTLSNPSCGAPMGTFKIVPYNNSYVYNFPSGLTRFPVPNQDTFSGPAGTYAIKASTTGPNGCTSASSNVTISDAIAKIWTGAVDNSWFNDGNWTDQNNNPTTAPTKDDCVTIKNTTSLLIDSTTKSAYAYSINIQSGFSLEIAAKSSLIVTNDINVNTGGKLTLQDSASLIQVNEVDPINNKNVNTGNIIVNRATTPASWNDYTYWSSPTSNAQTLFDFSPNSNPKYFLTYENTWSYAYPKITKFSAGIGYAIAAPITATLAPQTFKYQFIGTPNNGTVNVPITTGTGTYSSKLVGNPYPSAISADKFILANIKDSNNTNTNQSISGTIYFWTHSQDTASGSSSSNYATYNLLGGASTGTGTPTSNTTTGHGNHTAPEFYIASGQGFIVQTQKTGSITFNNDMRVGINNGADNSNFYRSATATTKPSQLEKHRIWLHLSDNSANFSQILFGYAESATNNYDPGFDGAYTNNDKFVLYSLIGTDPYTIQAKNLPFADTDFILLGFKAAVTGNATISIDNVDGLFAQGQNVFIEDKLTSTTHNLSTSSYTFNTDAGTFNDRFVIKYKDASTLGLDTFDGNKNNIFITAVNHMINVKCESENIQKVLIYDTLGRLIFENNNINSFETTISNLTTNQVYIVKAVLENGKSYNKKVIY